MPLTTIQEIQVMICQDISQLIDATYPEDLLNDWADAEVPVYPKDIIDEWTSLDAEYRDAWIELGYDGKTGIVDLMRIDLYMFYSQAFQNAWIDIEAAMKETQELV